MAPFPILKRRNMKGKNDGPERGKRRSIAFQQDWRCGHVSQDMTWEQKRVGRRELKKVNSFSAELVEWSSSCPLFVGCRPAAVGDDSWGEIYKYHPHPNPPTHTWLLVNIQLKHFSNFQAGSMCWGFNFPCPKGRWEAESLVPMAAEPSHLSASKEAVWHQSLSCWVLKCHK